MITGGIIIAGYIVALGIVVVAVAGAAERSKEWATNISELKHADQG